MSQQDNHPTVEDSARQIFPVTFFKDGDDAGNTTDFRPNVLPASAPEEEEVPVPKAESAPEPVVSPELPPVIVPTVPDDPAQPPATEVTGPPKVENPGPPVSSVPTTPGSPVPPAKTAQKSGSSRSAVKPS